MYQKHEKKTEDRRPDRIQKTEEGGNRIQKYLATDIR
jgi:hypothetical protein